MKGDELRGVGRVERLDCKTRVHEEPHAGLDGTTLEGEHGQRHPTLGAVDVDHRLAPRAVDGEELSQPVLRAVTDVTARIAAEIAGGG